MKVIGRLRQVVAVLFLTAAMFSIPLDESAQWASA